MRQKFNTLAVLVVIAIAILVIFIVDPTLREVGMNLLCKAPAFAEQCGL